MRKSQGAAVLFMSWAASMAPATLAAEVKVPQLRAYDQLTYTLVTHDEYIAKQVPGQTARIDAFLTQQLATPTHTPSLPTWIIVIPYDLSRRYFEVSDDRQIDFVPARFANYLLLEHSRNSHEIRDQLFHEYTHAFMRSQMKRYYPLWFEEGMATLMSLCRFEYSKVQIGMFVANNGPWIPLSRLFRIDRSSPEYLSENQASSVYLGSWALVHKAFIEDPAFNKQLFDFLAALNNFNAIDKAVPQSFGMSIDELDLQMRRYVQAANRDLEAFFEVKIPPVKEPDTPAGRSMSEAESLELLAEAMLAAGTRPERLGELVEAAHRKAPESPGVLALRLKLAVRDRDDAALTSLIAQSESRASDAAVARAIGLALFERTRVAAANDALSAADRERYVRRAFELLDRAVMSKPDDVEAIWGYGMLAAQLRQDLPNALRRLDRGFGIAANNPDLAMATALVLEAQGEQKKMVPFLVVTARMTTDTAQREWAITRVNTLLAAQSAGAEGK